MNQSIQYVQGDITKVTDGVVAHCCNCRGVMGGGVALAIRNQWPRVFERYSEIPQGEIALGTCQIVMIDDELAVANCMGQLDFGNDGKRYASPEAIESSLQGAFIWADAMDLTVRTVEMGCLRGGLDWEDDVRPIFDRLMNRWPNVPVAVYNL